MGILENEEIELKEEISFCYMLSARNGTNYKM